MTTEASALPRRGNPERTHNWNCENQALQSAAGKKGMKSKMDVNLLDALWAEVMALNRAAGTWGVPTPTLRGLR